MKYILNRFIYFLFETRHCGVNFQAKRIQIMKHKTHALGASDFVDVLSFQYNTRLRYVLVSGDFKTEINLLD